MAVSTETTKCRVVLKYDKEGSSSYNVSDATENQVLFDIASSINNLQSTPLKGVYRSIEEEIKPN